MALPDSQPLHNRAEFPNNKNPKPPLTYAAAAKRHVHISRMPTVRKSLISSPTGESQSSSSNVTVVQTRLWRQALAPDGYFFDISKVPNLTDDQHFDLIFRTYGPTNFWGIRLLGKASTRYIEFNPKSEILDKITTEGLYYDDLKLRLLPCKAIESEGSVIQLNLTDIPFLHTDQVLAGLRSALNPFGTILDVGLKYDSKWGFFMGAGYAAIQQESLTDPSQSYPKLSHTLPWTTGPYFCHATFANMPTWCRYCHDEGHTKVECPKALASIICYTCEKAGHRQADCPIQREKINRSYKKARKSPLPSETPEVLNTEYRLSNPNESIFQSQWATPCQVI
ncbi:MAG: hypothetical protein EXX96DRAFT_33669 [Benjaminiella poitrasii]|nr:MAG: hypothetical protein EXX96DRAFT_33669 [Benjaminiella poitrasii]